MKPSDLNILIQEGEGTTVKFKENLSGSFARELVAMANTIGGRILLGVRDDGTVIGVKDSNSLRARIQDLARNCDPPVKALVEPVGEVLVVQSTAQGTRQVTPQVPRKYPASTPQVPRKCWRRSPWLRPVKPRARHCNPLPASRTGNTSGRRT